MKWLFITSEPPWPLAHGTWLRVYHLARTLSQGGQSVSILSYAGEDSVVGQYRQIGVTLVKGPAGRPAERGKSRCWLGPYVYDEALAASIARHAGDYDVAVLVRPNLLQYAREAAQAGRVIADLVDDPVLEERRACRRTANPVRWAGYLRFAVRQRAYERAFLPWVTVPVFVSPQDAANFSRRHRGPRALAVPNGVDAAFFARSAGEPSGNGRPTVMFLGNLGHPPNEEAAFYLARQIAPLIWRQVPETTIAIVGSSPSPPMIGLAGPNIQITGWVPDVRPMLWKATLCVLAMQTGTGIKNKLLESWAAGTPVVTTPLACQGVPARDGENVLLGRSATELAEQAVRLMRDPRLCRALADHGRRTVRDHLTWSMAAERLCASILSG